MRAAPKERGGRGEERCAQGLRGGEQAEGCGNRIGPEAEPAGPA